MPFHKVKTCERCNNVFECKAGDIAHCQCSNIQLSVEERAFIEERYRDCLCAGCLINLKNRYSVFQEKFLFGNK
jgi:hypothetical protein